MEDAVAEFRRFARFFTQAVGALDASFLESGLSLPEVRLLYEIGQRQEPLAVHLQAALAMDPAFVSRVLARFEQQGLIRREQDPADGRRRPLTLTGKGRDALRTLEDRQQAFVAARLDPLGEAGRRDVVAALRTARLLLEPGEGQATIRTFRTGDLGLVVSRQAALYAGEFGWDGRLIEASECEIVAAFLRGFKPGREQCWIAEVDGRPAGSVFLTDEGDGVSRLRLFYVEGFARGRGIGSALVSECLAFARRVGYARMTLWTQSVLVSARRIYAAQGFTLVGTEPHALLGPPLVGETWERDLAAPPASPTPPARVDTEPSRA